MATTNGEAMNDTTGTRLYPTATHWGAYEAEVRDGRLVAMRPPAGDPDPSPMGDAMAAAHDDACRIRQPMVRRGWLERGPRAGDTGRGGEPFVAVGWDEALDLVAGELRRIRRDHGDNAIYGGSYVWASAGRFHHAPSQLHRFLAMGGGYTASTDSYSYAAGEVILPHILGPFQEVLLSQTSWPVIAEHGELVVSFGGLALRNGQVNPGGTVAHIHRDALARCRDAGVGFVLVGPMKGDVEGLGDADWMAARPNTDVAIMLALAHTIYTEGLHDRAFLDRYTMGFERFVPYLTGESDGIAKDAEWAAAIAEIDAERIRRLARRMAGSRTTILLSWSLTRGDHGEQPYWMGTVLAAMLGQIGLAGGGVGFGYGAVNGIGKFNAHMSWPSLDQGRNPIGDVIPVARIADLLLEPGATIDYNGRRLTFPDIRLVYWTGGNPFHHHQDLNRLLLAWQRPETVICHEPWWNALARHADIVLPATTTLERNDMSGSAREDTLLAMRRAVDPVGQSRDDHAIFADMAQRLGYRERFTEGRDEMGWLRHLYDRGRQRAAELAFTLPDFDTFWDEGVARLPQPQTKPVMLADFRADPDAHPLKTPSGRIEIFSQTIAGFGYDDCPGHPVWLEPAEWLGSAQAARFPLHLISSQPENRLHSQYDNGPVSRGAKVKDREAVMLNPEDASARGIAEGDVVRLFNARGACLAGAVLSREIRPGVVRLPTGAWYDPDRPGTPGALCRHGSVNVLTLDKGTSKLAQGPSAQTCLVDIERHEGDVPEVGAFRPPAIDEER